MGFVNTPLQNPLQNTAYQENMFADLIGRKDQLQQNAQVLSLINFQNIYCWVPYYSWQRVWLQIQGSWVWAPARPYNFHGDSNPRWFGHVERSTGWIAEVRRLNVVAQKRSGRPRKSWDEVLENDRKKLGMDSADPQNCSEWRGRLRERLVKKPNPR